MPPSRSFAEYCADLAYANIRLDEEDSQRAFEGLAANVKSATPEELTDGLARLVPALQQVATGNGGLLAQVAGSLIHSGAEPMPVLGLLVDRVAEGLEQAARMIPLAEQLGGELEEPTSEAEAGAIFDRVAKAGGLDPRDAAFIVQAWFTIGEWIPGLLVPLQEKRVRAALPQRERLVAAAEAAKEHVDDAHWLLGLALVLDDEQLLVIHRATRRAYDVTISGVGDNFQLHTLLAATLIGDPADGLIAGTPPRPEWVAAATDGDPQPSDGIGGQFNLVAANGKWIWNEGRPADIMPIDGRRVVVLDPPPYVRSWNAGRAYPLMVPEIRLNRVVPDDESAVWMSRIRGQSDPD
jgi:hypothetical protein